MTFSHKIAALAIAAFGIFATSTAANAQTAYAVAGGSTTLITFDVTNPGAAVAVGNFTLGGAPAFVDTMDFRPANGVLYGYYSNPLDSTDNALYTVNTSTAELTPVGTGGFGTNTNILDIDFNPSIDRFRIVTNSNQNLVGNPNTGTLQATATPLSYAIGDVNENTAPQINANAYAGNVAGSGFAFTQYAIDYDRDILTTLANNTGVLTTVGNLGVDTFEYTSFDIFTSLTGTNSAYAILDGTTGGITPLLYSINLANGAASGGAAIGGFTQVTGLAITPVVPEANTGVLLALGAGLLGTVGTVLRRKTAK